jgi:hypothetical protein
MNTESHPVRPADPRNEQITAGSIYAGRVKGAPPPRAVPRATILDLAGESIAANRDRHSLNVSDGSKEAVR